MRRHRSFVLGLTAILVVGVGAAWWAMAGRSNASIAAAPLNCALDEASGVAPRCFDTVPSGDQAVAAVATPVAIPEELSDEASALVAEAGALQLLAEGTDLKLEPGQWQEMAAVTLELQAVRHAYEATIATGAVVGEDAYRMEIPAYPSAGDALRARLRTELSDRLGHGVAEEILARLGARLEGRFGGFGVSIQTLDFTGHPWAENPDWVLARTVKYWNSVEGEDRLSTRRETFLPGREDPAGMSWGPLLLVASQQMKSAAGS